MLSDWLIFSLPTVSAIRLKYIPLHETGQASIDRFDGRRSVIELHGTGFKFS